MRSARTLRWNQAPRSRALRALNTYYGSADGWCRRDWRYTYRRRVCLRGGGTGRWATEWWNNDEATQRTKAL